MSKIENISTYRLDLVELQEGMTGLIHYMMSDYVVMKHMPFEVHKNEEETASWVAECIRNNASGHEMTWLIEDKKCFGMGWISAKEIGEYTYLISYCEKQAYWGNGYMQEAVNGVLEFLFTKCQAKRVLATCHPRNRMSEGVMRGVGMHRVWLDKKIVDKGSGETEYQHCYAIERF